MKIQSTPFSTIQYVTCPYPNTLRESLQRMGQGFPIKVKELEDGSLHCMDGHKRCSAIASILQQHPKSKLQNVNIIIMNKARTSSGTTMNHH